MKIFRKTSALILALLLFCGCAVSSPASSLPVSSEEAASSESPSSAQTSSSVSSEELPSSEPEFSSEPVVQISTEEALASLSSALTALKLTGAEETAQQQALFFAESAESVLPQSSQAVLGLLELCAGSEQPAELSALITAATEESGISRELFQLAAAACYGRGLNTSSIVTFTFTGDCTFSPINEESHSNSFDQVYTNQSSPSYPFDRMFPWFATDDITCINFEGTLTTSLAHAEKTYYFRGDPSFAKILPSSSVEVANLVNNHTMDYLQTGYDDTVTALTSVGTKLITAQQPYITTVDGIEVVLIGQQTSYGAQLAAETVKKYKRADNIVIVSMHWSTEFSNEVASVCVTTGRQLIDAGADLVIGHHPHVLQGMELYKGKYIVYSLGNFAFGANVGPVTAPYTMAFRACFSMQDGAAVMTNAEIIPCNPTSDPSGWNNYQPKPLFGEDARKVADFVISISSSLQYGVKELDYFDI